MLEYETANPGQDFDEHETKIFDPERDVDRPMVSLVDPAPSTSSPAAGRSRPISGDTLGGYRREEIPLEQVRSTTPGGQARGSVIIKFKGKGTGTEMTLFMVASIIVTRLINLTLVFMVPKFRQAKAFLARHAILELLYIYLLKETLW